MSVNGKHRTRSFEPAAGLHLDSPIVHSAATHPPDETIHVVIYEHLPLLATLWKLALRGIPGLRARLAEKDLDRLAEDLRDEDVLLVGTGVEPSQALEVAKKISLSRPGVKVLLCGVSRDKDELLSAVEAGYAGFIHDDDNLERAISTIQAAHHGRAYISPELTQALTRRLVRLCSIYWEAETTLAQFENLSAREVEVLELIAADLTNREISEQLVIELGTVKNHVHSILAKLEVSSRHDAARYFRLFQNLSKD